MKKILAAAVAVTASIFVMASIKIYGESNIIPTRLIESPNTRQNRTAIAEKVLEDTGRTGQFDPDTAQSILITYGNVSGDSGNEAIISLKFSPKNTIVAVYTPTENGFEYVGDVGEFFDIQDVEFFPIEGLTNDILILRENANQNIGSFENSSFVRGYLWRDNEFEQVLSLPEEITASWNTRWDGLNEQYPWKRITQDTDLTYSDGENPKIEAKHYQERLESTNTESENMPDASTFRKIDERILDETYFWNREWMRFILYEKIENATGQKVAVIEDFGTSPYALLPDFGSTADRVRIVRKDGSTDIVFKNTLSDIQ